MGMFDTVRCQADLPDARALAERDFQTKSLGCGLSRFTITEEGRLIFHQRQGVDLDTEYHGDVELWGRDRQDASVHYVARFSNGTLDWIRPFESMSELYQLRLLAHD